MDLAPMRVLPKHLSCGETDSFLDLDQRLAPESSPDSWFTVVQGTKVTTVNGELPVELVRPGDKVMTGDAGFQAVTTLAVRSMQRLDLIRARRLTPILLRGGALGSGLPCDDLYLHPATRIGAGQAGANGAVIRAVTDLVGDDGIDRVFPNSVTYVTFLIPAAADIVVSGIRIILGRDLGPGGSPPSAHSVHARGWRRIGTVVSEQI